VDVAGEEAEGVPGVQEAGLGEEVKILVACEFSGVVRDAFLRRGHDAVSCDILPTESAGPHLQRDVRDIIGQMSWDLMIAHPPCTYLTNAGVRWLYKGGKGSEPDLGRWDKMRAAADFFESLRTADIQRIAVENPIMHRHARELIGADPSQTVQPWMFGHAETKATCLWLKGLPLLIPTNTLTPDLHRYPAGRGNGFEPRVHHASPGPERWKERSRTLQGIADAMAEQWGNL
jgi:hypothetical protein